MGRLPGFDYKRPFFYMVTLKGLPPQTRGAAAVGFAGEPPGPPFSGIAADGKIIPNAVTEAFERIIAAFPKQWPWVASFSPHVIMPDHLHLMVKLGGREAALQNPTALQNLGREGLLAAASRIGPGGAGLSTFLSPLEKEAGNEILKAGGSLIVLSMEGFPERWHPSEKQERWCAAGRMLYLSPFEPRAARLTRQEMHVRAHALVDWALEHSQEQLEAWP